MSNVFNPKNVQAYNKLLSELPDLEIVITSNRKVRGMRLVHFKELFNYNHATSTRIIGVTPFLGVEDPGSSLIASVLGRGAEIKKYMEHYLLNPRHTIERFAIIDDQPEELQCYDFAKKLFLTKFSTGLTLEIVEKVVQYFNECDQN
jgi:hypothetical protein